MSRGASKRKRTQQETQQERTKVDPPDKKVLDSIGSPNAWTPEAEDAWLEELHNISAVEIYKRFPPMKKPNNVSRRGKTHGG